MHVIARSLYFCVVGMCVCVCVRACVCVDKRIVRVCMDSCVSKGQPEAEKDCFIRVFVCVLAVIILSKHIPPQTTKSLLVLSLAFLTLSCLFLSLPPSFSFIPPQTLSIFLLSPPSLLFFSLPLFFPLLSRLKGRNLSLWIQTLPQQSN